MRRKRREPIAVVDAAREPALAKWSAVGPALFRLEPARAARLLALAEAYLANHAAELEPREQLEARLAFARSVPDREVN